MTLVTIGKNGRCYQRKFDHDEALRLRGEGWTYPALAAHFSVTERAIERVVNPRTRARTDEHVRAWIQRQRKPCAGGCGRLVWGHIKGRTGLCPTCLGAERRPTVRDDTLRCSECEDWKPDGSFPRRRSAHARRGRHGVCRACQAAARQRTREARKVACTNCGKPRTNPRDINAGIGRRDTGLCRSCWQAAVKAIA